MEDKFRTIINFHLTNYSDPKKDMNPENVIISAMLLEGKIRDYAEYGTECIKKDIAGVSQKTWDQELK